MNGIVRNERRYQSPFGMITEIMLEEIPTEESANILRKHGWFSKDDRTYIKLDDQNLNSNLQRG